MPQVTTLDGATRVITILDDPGNNAMEVDAIEIYSEWKDWVRSSDNAKFLQAFTVIGGDPITPTQNLGTTFFLENGWRIRPTEKNHKLTVVGNLYTREPGQSAYLDTLGAFTVNTETRVSNLVDTPIAQVDASQVAAVLQQVLLALPKAHVSIVSDGQDPETLSVLAWLERGDVPVTSGLVSCTFRLRDPTGAEVIPSHILTPDIDRGTFRGDITLGGQLTAATNYYADLVIADATGAVQAYQATPTIA